MQRVTNCVLRDGNKVLLLQKPRRGWWVAPGGKMEQGESVKESVIREFREETGIELLNPEIRGIFTILIEEDGRIVSEWMMYTFYADQYSGDNKDESEEGKLEWHKADEIQHLPMAPGDYHIFEFMLKDSGVVYGTFTYTKDFELIDYRLDPAGN